MTAHAIERARERFGMELGEDGLHAIRRLIVSGKSLLSGKRDGDREFHLVDYGGATMRVLWLPAHQAIITVTAARWRLHPGRRKRIEREGRRKERRHDDHSID